MSGHILVEIYGLLHTSEIELASSHSKIPEIDLALQETIKHLQAAQASLKTALTYRPEKEK